MRLRKSLDRYTWLINQQSNVHPSPPLPSSPLLPIPIPIPILISYPLSPPPMTTTMTTTLPFPPRHLQPRHYSLDSISFPLPLIHKSHHHVHRDSVLLLLLLPRYVDVVEEGKSRDRHRCYRCYRCCCCCRRRLRSAVSSPNGWGNSEDNGRG